MGYVGVCGQVSVINIVVYTETVLGDGYTGDEFAGDVTEVKLEIVVVGNGR